MEAWKAVRGGAGSNVNSDLLESRELKTPYHGQPLDSIQFSGSSSSSLRNLKFFFLLLNCVDFFVL